MEFSYRLERIGNYVLKDGPTRIGRAMNSNDGAAVVIY